MIGIVPLAGPDFERPDGSVKSAFVVDGQPLLRAALESRPWWRAGLLGAADLIFVLHDSPISRRFAAESLSHWYPGARIAFVGTYTAGAALSAACGVGLVEDFATPLVVDLCDFLLDCERAPVEDLASSDTIGGMAATFASDLPKYSYLECDGKGRVVRAREKIVISDRASAGIYFFRSAEIYLRALAHAMRHRAELAHKGLLYVCPLMNGVIAQGLEVRCLDAHNVRDIHVG